MTEHWGGGGELYQSVLKCIRFILTNENYWPLEIKNLKYQIWKFWTKNATFLSGYKSYIFICIFERDYIETKFESISFSEKQEKSTPIDRLINVCELADHTARFPPQMVHVVAGVSEWFAASFTLIWLVVEVDTVTVAPQSARVTVSFGTHVTFVGFETPVDSVYVPGKAVLAGEDLRAQRTPAP